MDTKRIGCIKEDRLDTVRIGLYKRRYVGYNKDILVLKKVGWIE